MVYNSPRLSDWPKQSRYSEQERSFLLVLLNLTIFDPPRLKLHNLIDTNKPILPFEIPFSSNLFISSKLDQYQYCNYKNEDDPLR